MKPEQYQRLGVLGRVSDMITHEAAALRRILSAAPIVMEPNLPQAKVKLKALRALVEELEADLLTAERSRVATGAAHARKAAKASSGRENGLAGAAAQ